MSGPLPGWTKPIALPVSWIYGAAVAWRSRNFDAGRNVQSVSVPVISVGNVTAGGAGKSPFVRALAQRLRARGHAPVIAMRGYGAKAGEESDEAAEHARLCPDVPVVVDPDRATALRVFLEAHPLIDVAILDDGFQHRRLHRDLDIVLVDATRDELGGAMLPLGWLREPARALSRAGAVVVTRAQSADDLALAERIERVHGHAPAARTRHAWTGVCLFENGTERREPVEWLAGRRVVTALGIGHPSPMLEQLAACGAEVVCELPMRDHQRYDEACLRRIRAACRDAGGAPGDAALVTTMKDWVKLESLPAEGWPCPVAVPVVEIEFLAGESELMRRIESVL